MNPDINEYQSIMNDTIIIGGFLIVDSHTIHKNWGLVIQGNSIHAIGPNSVLMENYSAKNSIDAADKIIMPGFVNGHNHAYGILSHGIPIDRVPAGFKAFLEDFWWPCVENRLDHELITAAVAASCYEMIDSGITSFCDVLEAPNAVPGSLKAEAEIVRKSGLRAVLCIEASERVSRENGLKCLKENADFIQSSACKSDLISGMMCTHTSFTCSKEFLCKALEISRSLNISLHIHLSESSYEPEFCLRKYGLRPVNWYDSFGFWSEDILTSQLVAVEQEEIALLSRNNVRGVHMPLSNCEVGGGIAPVPKILAKGLSLGLGTDGYINNFFEVMRGAFLIHKANNRNTDVMPSETVFKMATEAGAEAVGFSGTGRLDVGYSADLIAINSEFPTPLTEKNILDQVILYRNPSDVSMVMVAGKMIKENGRVLTLSRERVREQSRKAAQKLWQLNR